MVSTLTTISKAGVLYAVAQSISQLKWVYYTQRPRRLANIDLFNNAGESPVGALGFLIRIPDRLSTLLTSIASVTVIAALAFEPMAQQVFTFRAGLITDPHQASVMPIAQVYDTGAGIEDGQHQNKYDYKINNGLQAAILDGFFASSSRGAAASLSIPTLCPSGNCTWPEFTTLGVCSSCSSDNSTVKVDCEKERLRCTYTWPSGMSTGAIAVDNVHNFWTLLNITAPLPRYVTQEGAWTERRPTDVITSFAMVKWNPPLTDQADEAGAPFLRGPNGSSRIPPPDAAWECSLKWCAQRFDDASVRNSPNYGGIPSRTWPLRAVNYSDGLFQGVNENYEPQDAPGFWDAENTYAAFEAQLNDTEHIPNRTYTINWADAIGITSYFGNLLNINQTYPGGSTEQGFYRTNADVSSVFTNTANISELMYNVSLAMSNGLRLGANASVGAGYYPENKDVAPTSVNGTAMVSTTFVDVEWAWLSLPAVIIALGTGILIAAMIISALQENHVPGSRVIWRSSNVGLLTQGLQRHEMMDPGLEPMPETKEGRQEWAKDVKVQLKRDSGWVDKTRDGETSMKAQNRP